MLDPEAYVDQGLKAVDHLIDRGELATALKVCEELLRVHPYHKGAQEYIQNIHAQIVKKNEEIVDEDIQKTMKLWDEHRYDELRTVYAKLLIYSPQHKKLRGLIMKLDSTVTKEAQEKRYAIKQKALEAIKSLITQKQFTDALQACDELNEYFPGDAMVENISRSARYAYIDEQLKINDHFVHSADFMEAEAFYASLMKIDPNHPQLKKLLEQTRAHGAQQRILAAKIHLNESIERMKKLWTSHEYEKVIQLCEEIIQQDTNNFTAKLYKKRAASILLRESDALEYKQLKEHWAHISLEYKKNPTAFIMI